MVDKHWNRDTALKQIDSCEFTCEAGPLAKNEAWKWLRTALELGPKFLPGQGVFCEIKAEVDGETLTKWKHYWVVQVRMDSGTDSRYWTYWLSCDPPAPCHFGTISLSAVREEAMRLEIPAKGGDDA